MGHLNCRVLFLAGYVSTGRLQTSMLALLHPLGCFCASEASRVSETGSCSIVCKKQAAQGEGCRWPKACSLCSTKPYYHLLHGLLSSLPDRLAFGGIASVSVGRKVPHSQVE